MKIKNKTIYFPFLIIFIIIIIFSNYFIYSQPVTQEWVARYNTPPSYSDLPNSIIIDKFGNSFATGTHQISNGGYRVATVKFNNAGIHQWSRLYFDPNSQDNFVTSITIDTSGNLYIAGYSGYVFGNDLYSWIVKYNTNGDSVWVRRIYALNTYMQSSSITADKTGNIYLLSFDNSQTYITKYNNQGDTLWRRGNSITGTGRNRGNAIMVDTSGNVFISGVAYILPYQMPDYMVVKYNSIGEKLWSKTYGVPNQYDYCYRMAIDKNSNVYLTGYGFNTSINNTYDFLTLNYDKNGNLQWSRYFHRNIDEGHDVAIDQLNNVIVTGKSSYPGNGMDYCTIKYNQFGDSLWVRIYNGGLNYTDLPYFINVDLNNNIYVTGQSYLYFNYKEIKYSHYNLLKPVNINNGNITTIKYSPSGTQMWLMQYPGGMYSSLTEGQCLVTENSNNIFVLGTNNLNGTSDDYIIIKYSQSMGITENNEYLKERFRIKNLPNPFNNNTSIRLEIHEKYNTNITIYDSKGSIIEKLLINKELDKGHYNILWHASNFSSGIYFCRIGLKSEYNLSYIKVLKLLLIK